MKKYLISFDNKKRLVYADSVYDAIRKVKDYRTETFGEEITTFTGDFDIAEKFGVSAVKDTFRRAFNSWKNNYKYLTNLVMVLNHKIFEHYNTNPQLSKVYQDLYYTANDYALQHLKGDERKYFYRVTDSKSKDSINDADIAEYQKWVDYDIKNYGRLSEDTKRLLRENDLEVVKDDHGDYEVVPRETYGHHNYAKDDIEKSRGGWVNRGKEGTHGKFATKREARKQQKAMFASGYKGDSRICDHTIKVSNPTLKIKEWYTKTFPSDSLGDELDSQVTVGNIVDILNDHKGERLYVLLGVGDSIIRERIFGLIEKMSSNSSYDDIYSLWLED